MLVFAAATSALIAGAQARAPAWVLLTASALAGSATPQLGSVISSMTPFSAANRNMRGRWRRCRLTVSAREPQGFAA
jgi:hypothetical protein